MRNTQATVEDLIDELTDVLEKGWRLPFAGGKSFIDSEDAKQILDEIREAIPSEVRKAKASVADRAQIISEAQREAETTVRGAEEKAKALVNQEEIARQAQAKANDIMAQTQEKFRSMQKASNDYVEDLLRRTDDAMSANLAELRKPRQYQHSPRYRHHNTQHTFSAGGNFFIRPAAHHKQRRRANQRGPPARRRGSHRGKTGFRVRKQRQIHNAQRQKHQAQRYCRPRRIFDL